jgi:hypothetical protein
MATSGRREGGANPRTMRAGQVIAMVIGTLALAAVLNADSLVRDTRAMPFGATRDRWLSFWAPFERVGDITGLDAPRNVLNDITDRDDGSGEAFVTVDRSVAQLPVVPTPVTRPTLPAVVAPIAPTSTPQPAVRVPSPDEPLKLWVGGDSLAIRFGESLVRQAIDTGVIEAELDARISTGLARPDYFNWPAELEKVNAEVDPDVMVVLFGSNDSQGLVDPAGDVYGAHSEGWRREYARRVGAAMELLAEPDRLVLWVGLPPMRDGDFSQRLADINSIYQSAAAAQDGVIYLDIWPLFSDAEGQYVAYSEEPGDARLVREPDGVHMTRAGGDILADAVMSAIGDYVELDPTATTPP